LARPLGGRRLWRRYNPNLRRRVPAIEDQQTAASIRSHDKHGAVVCAIVEHGQRDFGRIIQETRHAKFGVQVVLVRRRQVDLFEIFSPSNRIIVLTGSLGADCRLENRAIVGNPGQAAFRTEVIVAGAAFRVSDFRAILGHDGFRQVKLVGILELELFEFFGGKRVVENHALANIQADRRFMAFRRLELIEGAGAFRLQRGLVVLSGQRNLRICRQAAQGEGESGTHCIGCGAGTGIRLGIELNVSRRFRE
jgi:hypothetical protein